MQPVFTIKEALSFGWNKFRENWVFLVLLTLGFFIVNAIFNNLGNGKEAIGIFKIVNIILSYFAMYTFVRIGLKIYAGGKPAAADILDVKWGAFFMYVLASIVSTVVIVLGYFLLIIPGLYLTVRLGLFAFAMVDEGLAPMDALKRSLALTKGRFWPLFGFSLVLALINITGALLLGLGLLVSAPLCLLATVFVYQKLKASHVASPVAPEATVVSS